MDLGKLRGNDNQEDNRSSSFGQSDNAKKDADSNGRGDGPKSLMDTKPWKKGKTGVFSIWSNYVNVLATTFQNYSRFEQERLITVGSQVITLGCSTVLICLFYPFVPQPVRLIAVPAILVGAWFVSTRVVSQIIIAQFDDKLNKE